MWQARAPGAGLGSQREAPVNHEWGRKDGGEEGEDEATSEKKAEKKAARAARQSGWKKHASKPKVIYKTAADLLKETAVKEAAPEVLYIRRFSSLSRYWYMWVLVGTCGCGCSVR